mmetsp:Transcript_28829/g.42479  ORF Transcript_28829/g.42479 Transcript_28829/m.42479 type:complete len:85 (+) Transcript_28829:3027-3281(+)
MRYDTRLVQRQLETKCQKVSVKKGVQNARKIVLDILRENVRTLLDDRKGANPPIAGTHRSTNKNVPLLLTLPNAPIPKFFPRMY